MLKTSKEFMEWLGLQVGDRIKISVENNEFIYEIRLNAENKPYLLNEQNLINCGDVHSLIDMDFEILPRPKRVGDLKCMIDINDCKKCPLYAVCEESYVEGITLYEELQYTSAIVDQEIYDLLKDRLDKEVE